MKCLNGWSNKSFTMLWELLKKALPASENFLTNHYETKKILLGLGLDYKKIDACPLDCMLFTKEYANSNNCIRCGTSQ